MIWLGKGGEFLDKRHAFLLYDETGGLHSINQQVQFRDFKMPGSHIVEILHLAVFYDVQTELRELVNVSAQRPGIRLREATGLQMCRYICEGYSMSFVSVLQQVFLNNKGAICMWHLIHSINKNDGETPPTATTVV